MSRWDRFRHLEGRRPEEAKPEEPPASELGRFREASWDPTAPRNCLACGADNNAVARCHNCSARLDTPEMRAHQARHQQARREREARERIAEQALEEARRAEQRAEAEARAARRRGPDGRDLSFGEFLLAWFRDTPFWTLVRFLRRIESSWLQALAQLGVVLVFAGLCVAAATSRFWPLYLLGVAVLLGFRPWRWLGYWIGMRVRRPWF